MYQVCCRSAAGAVPIRAWVTDNAQKGSGAVFRTSSGKRRRTQTEVVRDLRHSAHIENMNARISQIVLLTAAALIGLLNPAYNGLTLLALGLVAITGYLGYRARTEVAEAEAAAAAAA